MQKENFTLSSSLIQDISKNSLIPYIFYETGVLDTTKQIQTVTQERNRGTPCGSFPIKVYRVSTQPANATCRIGGTGTSISLGAQAEVDANVVSHYSFINPPVNTGTTIKGNANL
jgi:hypothetical protein